MLTEQDVEIRDIKPQASVAIPNMMPYVAGGALLFFTLQALYLINGGHVAVHLRLAPGAYLRMSWVWVAFFGAAALLLTPAVANSLRTPAAGTLRGPALLLLAIPTGSAMIMAGIGLRLRRRTD